MTKKYNNPPLIEVLCEFLFDESDLGIEQIETEIRGALDSGFSNRIEKHNIKFDIDPTKGVPEGDPESKIKLIQLKNPEKGSIVQFGKDILAVNQLSPYTTWEDFLPFVMEQFRRYQQVCSVQKTNQIKVRYINRINVPVEDSNIGKYFKYTLAVPEELSKGLSSFNVKTEHVFNNGRDLLVLELHNIKSSSEKVVSFIWDLSYVLLTTDSLESEIEEWLNEAHLNINRIFEASLTESCKKLFD